MAGPARLPAPARRLAMLAGVLVLLALGAVLSGAPGGSDARAAHADLERFFGTYVGTAEVEDFLTGERQRRDMDIVIEPYSRDGFRLHWVNVTLVDGRRAVPGVERRVQTVLFEHAPARNLYLEVDDGNPFREREVTRPMRGDPVRWATVNERGMHVYSFVVLEDGRYEIQVYNRVPTDIGLDVDFERVVDGEVVRRITGTTARANSKVGDE